MLHESGFKVPADRIIGAVLAGGQSRRMGRDKALIEIEGQPMVARAAAVLDRVFEEVVVVGPSRSVSAAIDLRFVPDVRPGLGPVGGLYTALDHAAGADVFVLACDLPHAGSELVRWVMAATSGDPDSEIAVPSRDVPLATVVADRGRVQPLCGLYCASGVEKIRNALDGARLSAVGLLKDLDARRLQLDHEAAWYRPDLLVNVNDAQDLRELKVGWGVGR